MHVLERQILEKALVKMGFNKRGSHMLFTKGKVHFDVHLMRFHKIVVNVRGMGDTGLHTSQPGRALKDIKNWLKEIGPKKPYGGN